MSGGCKDLTRPTPIIYVLKDNRISQIFRKEKLSSSGIHCCYIILGNVEEKEKKKKKKACSFFLLENSRPLSPRGPLDFLSTYLGINSLMITLITNSLPETLPGTSLLFNYLSH